MEFDLRWTHGCDYQVISELPSDLGPIVALDTEGPRSGFNARTDPPYTVQLSDRPGRAFILRQRDLEILRPLFESDARILVYNAIHEILTFGNTDLPFRWDEDVMLMAYIENTNESASLCAASARHLAINHPHWSPELYGDSKVFVRYACGDADLTLRLYLKLKDSAAVTPRVYRLERGFVPALVNMHRRGVSVNQGELTRLGGMYQEAAKRVRERVWKAVGHDFELDSHAQVRHVLFEELKLEPTSRTTGGLASTSKDALAGLALQSPVVADILMHRRLVKRRGTYLDKLGQFIEDDGKVHASILNAVVPTFRLACTRPNLMNQPKRSPSKLEKRLSIRDVFVPSPGCYFFGADFSQIELRLMIYSSADRALIELLESGVDFHTRTACIVSGRSEGSITAEERAAGKTVNYALCYGATPSGLVYRLGFSKEVAQRVVSRLQVALRPLFAWMDRERGLALETGESRTFLGRVRSLPDLGGRGYNKKRALRNVINDQIQGGAAQLFKLALIRADATLPSEIRLLIPVHDEALFEVSNEVPVVEAVRQVRSVLELDMGPVGCYPVDFVRGVTGWGRMEKLS